MVRSGTPSRYFGTQNAGEAYSDEEGRIRPACRCSSRSFFHESWYFFGAPIKYLGNLPCPRCLIHKSEIHELGTKRDFKRRETKVRVDDDRRRMLVETARGMLYKNGLRPSARGISDLLASRSLTPTRVSSGIPESIFQTNSTFMSSRTPSPNVFRNTALIFTPYLLLI